MGDTFITLKHYYQTTVTIDDAAGNVVSLPVRVRRFSVGQMQAYQAQYHRFEHPAHERRIYRQPEGEEQAKRPVTIGQITTEVYAIPDAEITRRRLVEMTPEARAEYERERAEEETFQVEFLTSTVRDHVWVDPSVALRIEHETTGELEAVTTGADLVRVFGGNPMVLGALARAVHDENSLTPEQKKRRRSRSSSTPGSSKPKADGPTPAVTADAAAPAGSVPSAPAPAVLDSIPCGSATT